MHNSTPILMSCILVVMVVSHGFIVWCMYRLSHFAYCKLLEPRCDHACRWFCRIPHASCI